MKEIEELKHKIKQLEDELTFLKTHPVSDATRVSPLIPCIIAG